MRCDLNEIKDRNENWLMIGDLNRAIGADKLGVMGNKSMDLVLLG